MDNQDFKVNIKTLWGLFISHLLVILLGSFAKLYHWDISQALLTLGLMLFFSVWVITLSDILKTRIFNRSFWIMGMFITPPIAILFYLIRRNRLLKLGTTNSIA